MSKELGTETITMKIRINHHQMDQVIKIDNKGGNRCIYCQDITIDELDLQLLIRLTAAEKPINQFISKKRCSDVKYAAKHLDKLHL